MPPSGSSSYLTCPILTKRGGSEKWKSVPGGRQDNNPFLIKTIFPIIASLKAAAGHRYRSKKAAARRWAAAPFTPCPRCSTLKPTVEEASDFLPALPKDLPGFCLQVLHNGTVVQIQGRLGLEGEAEELFFVEQHLEIIVRRPGLEEQVVLKEFTDKRLQEKQIDFTVKKESLWRRRS